MMYVMSCRTAFGAHAALLAAHLGSSHEGASAAGGWKSGYRCVHASLPNALSRIAGHGPAGPPPAWLRVPRRGSHVLSCPVGSGR